METALGLIGVVLFIVGVIGLASAVTWTVVKITPAKDKKKREQPAEPETEGT
jgi:hypothetical protein